jgi:hypothetical protein
MNTFNNSIKLSAVLLLLVFGAQSFAQDSVAGPDRRPVKEVFNSSLLIDQYTNIGPYKGGLELIIHHRFGTMDKGFSDLAGIYASSNIRMGFNYGITEKLSVGFGTERYNKQTDIFGKYLILQQKRTGMPVNLSFLTEIAFDGRDTTAWEKSYSFTNRISYFNQLIVSRKFNSKLSLQAAASFVHFNAVASDSTRWNDYTGVSVGGRYKFHNEMSIIATYDQGFAFTPSIPSSQKTERMDKLVAPKPSFGLGLEIGSPTHCFMVFVSNSNNIVPQNNFAFNTTDMFDSTKGFFGRIRLGFNLTVRF